MYRERKPEKTINFDFLNFCGNQKASSILYEQTIQSIRHETFKYMH